MCPFPMGLKLVPFLSVVDIDIGIYRGIEMEKSMLRKSEDVIKWANQLT